MKELKKRRKSAVKKPIRKRKKETDSFYEMYPELKNFNGSKIPMRGAYYPEKNINYNVSDKRKEAHERQQEILKSLEETLEERRRIMKGLEAHGGTWYKKKTLWNKIKSFFK